MLGSLELCTFVSVHTLYISIINDVDSTKFHLASRYPSRLPSFKIVDDIPQAKN